MKKYCLLHLLLFLFVTISAQEMKSNMNDETKIKNMLTKYAEAWKSFDAEKFSQIFVNDDRLVLFTTTDNYYKFEDLQNYINSFSEKAEITDMKFTNSKVTLHSSGKVAWLTAIESVKWTDKNEEYSFDSVRVSWVLEKIDNSWKVVQAHYSVPY